MAASNAVAAGISMSAADMPCCNAPDNCKNAGTCAIKCFNFAGLLMAPAELPPPTRAKTLATAGDSLHGHISSPPTHPPPA